MNIHGKDLAAKTTDKFVEVLYDYALKYHANMEHDKLVPNTVVIFDVLFVVFTAFCDKNYNGIIR